MSRCYKGCKHYSHGWCTKYDEHIIVSQSPWHPELLVHPLESLSMYYKEDNDDIYDLMDLAERYLDDEVSESICNLFVRIGQISFKQRKLLVYKLLNCYEEKEPEHYMDFYQVED